MHYNLFVFSNLLAFNAITNKTIIPMITIAIDPIVIILRAVLSQLVSSLVV